MEPVSVQEYVDGAIESVSLRRAQVKAAGNIIAQFLLVREGLQGRIPEDELSATAATLAAGIWAAPE